MGKISVISSGKPSGGGGKKNVGLSKGSPIVAAATAAKGVAKGSVNKANRGEPAFRGGSLAKMASAKKKMGTR